MKPGSSPSSLADYTSTRDGSISSLPFNQGKRKPSPLRLQPSDLELSGRVTNDPARVGGIGGAYLLPLPSPRSNRSATPCSDTRKPEGWVNPLDILFTRPSTPASSISKSRPTSYLPKLNFPIDRSHKASFETSQVGADTGRLWEPPSTMNSEENRSIPGWTPPLESEDKLVVDDRPGKSLVTPSSTVIENYTPSSISDFPRVPSQAARKSGRSIFPASDDQPRSSPRRNLVKKEFDFGFIPPVPLENLPPNLSTLGQPSNDPDRWHSTRAVIRDSIVSKQRVSIYDPTDAPKPQQAVETRDRSYSLATSSIYRGRTSILDLGAEPLPVLQTRSHSPDINSPRPIHGHSSQPLSGRQSSPHRSLRKRSPGSPTRRNSKEDQMHFDSSSITQDRASFRQERTSDFDCQQYFKFPDPNTISHFASASASSTSSGWTRKFRTQRESAGDDSPTVPQLDFDDLESQKFQVNPLVRNSSHRRSPSETSHNSINDVYDAYYRQSTLAQRESSTLQSNSSGTNLRTSGLILPGNSVIGQEGRRPPHPLKLGPRGLGGAGLMGETILELPIPRPVGSSRGREEVDSERFPELISTSWL